MKEKWAAEGAQAKRNEWPENMLGNKRQRSEGPVDKERVVGGWWTKARGKKKKTVVEEVEERKDEQSMRVTRMRTKGG